MQITSLDNHSTFNIEHHNNQTIEKIQALAKEGKSLGCFVCRGANQTVPLDGRTWVSLDMAREAIPDERLHLILDVNNEVNMAKIKNIFSKVILDWSSLLCCENPYYDLQQLLTLNPNSELLIEAIPGSFGSNFNDDISINTNNGQFSVPMERGNLTVMDIWRQYCLPDLKEYMSKLFKEVSYSDGEWPLADNPRMTDYFVLRGPIRE